MEWIYVWEAILQLSSEAQNSFWIKNRTGEDVGHFSAGPSNKSRLQFYQQFGKSTWTVTKDILSIYLY